MSRSKRKSASAPDTAAGFTLLEVVVALTLGAIGLALLLGVVSQGLGETQTSDRYLEATRRAQSHLAEIGVTSGLTPGVSSGDDGGGFAWRTQIFPPLAHPPLSGKAATMPATLYIVEATVSWQAGRQQRQVTLQSKRLGPP